MLRPWVRTSLALIVLSVVGGSAPAAADLDIDINFFHSGLAPYGRWVDHDHFGEIWVPRVGHGWRPYTVGRWVYADDCGWLWVEDEPFGWATHHYGRWHFDRRFGWVWIPGFQWAPAWVSWRSGRHGDDHWVGWAPLPPRGYGLDHGRWIFVPQRGFLAPRLRDFFVVPSRTLVLVQHVPVIGHVEQHGDRWVNHGIDVGHFERAVDHKLDRVKIRDAERAQGASLDEKTKEIAVYRPRVHAASDAKTRERDALRARLTGTQPDESLGEARPTGSATRGEPKAKATRPSAGAEPPHLEKPRPYTTPQEKPKAEPRATRNEKPKPELRTLRTEPSNSGRTEPRATRTEKLRSKPPAARTESAPSQPERAPKAKPHFEREPKAQSRPERMPQASGNAPRTELRSRTTSDRQQAGRGPTPQSPSGSKAKRGGPDDGAGSE